LKLTHILCPTDFSEASAHALEQATVFAGWYHAKITVLSVHTPAVLAVPMPFGTSGLAGGEHAAEIERLQSITASFAAPALKAGVEVEIRVDMGLPAAQIIADASALSVDVIVMGTHGTSGFQHLVLGSVTEKVLRKAGCPVLTVPPRTHSTSRLPLTHILCPIDFSDSSLSAVAWAWSLAQESRATVSLLHVIEWPWEEPPPPPFEELPPNEARKLADFRRLLETTSQARLESLVAENVREECPWEGLIRHGKPYREVLAAAATCEADLIVMGVHGRNVVDLALFGSTTNHVVRSASCPVLTVRARA
jgi:nucleotide-binding universal stress UspA family protein